MPRRRTRKAGLSNKPRVELEPTAPSRGIDARILEPGERSGPPSMKTISQSDGTFDLTDAVAELMEHPRISWNFRDLYNVHAVLKVELPRGRGRRAKLIIQGALEDDSDDDFGSRLAQLQQGDRSVRISGRYRFRGLAGSPAYGPAPGSAKRSIHSSGGISFGSERGSHDRPCPALAASDGLLAKPAKSSIIPQERPRLAAVLIRDHNSKGTSSRALRA